MFNDTIWGTTCEKVVSFLYQLINKVIGCISSWGSRFVDPFCRYPSYPRVLIILSCLILVRSDT